jgi:hypothetical protein
MGWGTGLAGLAAYVLATVLLTWPLGAHLATHFPAPSHPSTYDDTLLLAWVLSWDVHQLLRAPFGLFEANIFHPLRHTLGYSEALVSQALTLLPLAPLTPAPVLLHNVALLSSFVLGGFGAFLLVRHLSGSALAGFLGGLLFAFAPYRFWQIDRLHALSLHWTPFVFLALHRYFESGGARRAVLLAAAVVMQALASVYVAYATVVLGGLFVLGWMALGPPETRRRVAGAAGALALAATLVAAVYAPYAVVRDEMALGRDPAQVVVQAVVPAEIGRAVAGAPSYLAAKLAGGVKGAGTLGVTAALLLMVGVVAGGRAARLYASLALVALLLSFGPVIVLPGGEGRWVTGPYRLLYDHLPGFTALREPRRWTGMVVACGAIAAGLGTAALLGRVRRPGTRALVAAALVALVALEVGWRPLRLEPAPETVLRGPIYRLIAASPSDGAVVELPIGGERDGALATFRSAYHLRPLVNGYSGFRPTTAELRRRLRRFPSRRTLSLLRSLGVRFIVYDTTRPQSLSPASLRRRVERVAPSARIGPEAGGALLIEVEPLAAAAAPPPRGQELPRAAWTARASSGDAGAAIDGDLRTRWSAAVDAEAGGGWLEVDFGEEVELDRISLELGPHFGEYPRAWRIVASDGRREWLVAARRYAPAPLVSYRRDHRRVAVNLALPRTRARWLRIEVPPLKLPGRRPGFAVPPEHWGFTRWGVHELRIYRTAARSSA